MDEAAFRATRGIVNDQPCIFEKALLVQCADCAMAARHALAERETIGCRSPGARANCATLLGLLRERSAFALKTGPRDVLLPHALTMRLQGGGLAGLAQAVEVEYPHDVHALVAAAQARFGAFSDLPWPGIVAAVSAWQGRPRRESTS